MKLNVTTRVNIMRGDATVSDENGALLFRSKGKLISIRRKKKIYNANGELTFVIKNALFHVPFKSKTALIYDGNKNRLGKLVCKSMFKREYVFAGYGEEISVKGLCFGNYQIFSGDEIIATVTSNFSIYKGKLVIDCPDEKYAGLSVALLLALINATKQDKG